VRGATVAKSPRNLPGADGLVNGGPGGADRTQPAPKKELTYPWRRFALTRRLCARESIFREGRGKSVAPGVATLMEPASNWRRRGELAHDGSLSSASHRRVRVAGPARASRRPGSTARSLAGGRSAVDCRRLLPGRGVADAVQEAVRLRVLLDVVGEATHRRTNDSRVVVPRCRDRAVRLGRTGRAGKPEQGDSRGPGAVPASARSAAPECCPAGLRSQARQGLGANSCKSRQARGMNRRHEVPPPERQT